MALLSQQEVNKLLEERLPMERAWGSTVSIVIVDNKSLKQLGTGTLFRVANESFVVTAAHVIEIALRHGGGMGISGLKDNFIGFTGDAIISHESVDVSVVHLSDAVVQKLDGCTFLTLNDVCFTTDLSQGVFTLFGFPAIWVKDDGGRMDMKRFQFTSPAFEGDTSFLLGYDKKYHILVNGHLIGITESDGSQVEFTKHDGSPANFPGDLGGISGCGVWKIADLPALRRGEKGEGPRIVGVESCVYSKPGCIRATRWAVVNGMIHERFPALRPVLFMWRGGS
jgi:hypothetical protein